MKVPLGFAGKKFGFGGRLPYAQACFYAQQCGEKAIKALWFFVDADPMGHSVQKLISEFPEQSRVPDWQEWVERGRVTGQILHAKA